MDSRYGSLLSTVGPGDGRTDTQRAIDAVINYRTQLGLAALVPSNCQCSVPGCDLCIRRIGAWADSGRQYDPLKLMAIAETNGVTLKLTHAPVPHLQGSIPLYHYVVCILFWQGEALIYDDGIEGQVDG